MSAVEIPSNKVAARAVGKYVDAVLAGDIVAGPSIRAVCQRHRDDLKRSKSKSYPYKFDAEKAGRMMNFFPAMLTLRSGKWDDKQFELFDWQKFVVGSLGGWVHKKGGRRRYQDMYLQAAKNSGKALACNTPMLTANRGWTTHGDLKPGDFVFGSNGSPVEVLQRHATIMPGDAVIDDTMFEVEFKDGAKVVCNAKHLWQVRCNTKGKHKIVVRDTAWVGKHWLKGPRGYNPTPNLAVKSTPTLHWGNFGTKPLLDGYVLGHWLGDGDKCRANFVCSDEDALFVLDQYRRAGFIPDAGHQWDGMRAHKQYRVKGGLRQALSACGVLAKRRKEGREPTCKHIPEAYFTASYKTRLALLQGLMDSDGSAHYTRAACSFSNTNRKLIDGVVRLCKTLGIRCGIYAPKLRGRPTKRGPEKQEYSVHFTAPKGMQVFCIPRKQKRLDAWHAQRHKASYTEWNYIKGIRLMVAVPANCITVAAADGIYLAGEQLTPTHNSPLCAGLSLYMLIADGEPAAEVYLAAATYDQAGIIFSDILKAVESNIDLNERLIVRGGEASPREITYRPEGGSMCLMRRIANNSTGKNISGFRPSAGVFDEVAFWKSPEMLDAMRRGGGKREQPLMLMLTNAGMGVDSVAWPLYQHAHAVAHGEVEDDTHFPLIFDIDKTDDVWNDESCWVKANPSFPALPTPEALRKEIARCKSIPGERNSVRRQHFNEWVSDASQYFLGEEEIDAVMVDSLDENKLGNLPMVVGLDLSRRDDLTAAAQVWKDENDVYYIRVNFWVPDDGLMERAQQVPRLPWDVWARESVISATEGKVVDYAHVVEFLLRMRDDWKFRGIAFDDWRSDMLFREFQQVGVELYLADREGLHREPPAGKMVLWKHPQGFNRANPSRKPGADIYDNGLKSPLWMCESIELLKNSIMESKVVIERNPCMRYNLLSVKVVENDSGGMRFTKSKSTGKIDGVVAAAMGIGLSNALPERSTTPRAMLVG